MCAAVVKCHKMTIHNSDKHDGPVISSGYISQFGYGWVLCLVAASVFVDESASFDGKVEHFLHILHHLLRPSKRSRPLVQDVFVKPVCMLLKLFKYLRGFCRIEHLDHVKCLQRLNRQRLDVTWDIGNDVLQQRTETEPLDWAWWSMAGLRFSLGLICLMT